MLKDDVLEGAEQIGDYIGKPARKVYHLAATGAVPTFKIGSVIHARKSELDARFRSAATAR